MKTIALTTLALLLTPAVAAHCDASGPEPVDVEETAFGLVRDAYLDVRQRTEEAYWPLYETVEPHFPMEMHVDPWKPVDDVAQFFSSIHCGFAFEEEGEEPNLVVDPEHGHVLLFLVDPDGELEDTLPVELPGGFDFGVCNPHKKVVDVFGRQGP